jgi:Ca-activated chloride channel homolog
MKLSASLDVNVVAHETTDEVAVLIDLEAPAPVGDAPRAPSSLQVVLDRSGSMAGAPLQGAQKALVALVQRLEPTDSFGLVTFDDEAQVVIPCGPLTDKATAIHQIQGIHPGGTTDLGAGYLRGLRELRRVSSAGGTLLVVSDGHVNAGITDVDQFASLGSKAYADGVVTSTLGYGRGYDETLLAALARSGSGNHVFADNPDAAGAAIAREVDGLLDKVVQAATLTVTFQPAVQMVKLYNDLPAHQIADGTVMVELGDLYAQEQRKLLMRFQVPAMASLGLAQIATLSLTHVELPGLVEHTMTVPITVNVVPGDEAAERVPDPTVRSEVLFQEAQDTKRRASEAFERGDVDAGQTLLAETRAVLDAAELIAPGSVVESIRAERDEVGRMHGITDAMGAPYMSKLTRDSYHQQNRKRGRRPDSGM